jgi:hypothetical protein
MKIPQLQSFLHLGFQKSPALRVDDSEKSRAPRFIRDASRETGKYRIAALL